MNDAIKLLDGNTIIKEKIPALIEVFVEFYGEENRSYIEERFNSMFPICFTKPDEKRTIIKKAMNQIQTRLYENFYDKYNLTEHPSKSSFLPYDITETGTSLMDKYQKYVDRKNTPKEVKFQETVDYCMNLLHTRFGLELSFEEIKARKGTPQYDKFISLLPSYIAPQMLSVLADEYNDTTEELLKDNLIEDLSKIYPEITKENFDEYYKNRNHNCLKDLDSMLTDFQNMKKDFAKEIEPIKPYLEYCQKCELLEKEVYEKALYNFILEYKDYLPPEEFEEFITQKEKNGKVDIYRLGTINFFFADKINIIPNIECFSSNSEEELQRDPTSWKSDSIRYERMKYFKSKGINHEKNYPEYMEDPECIKLIPSKEFVDKLLEDRTRIQEQAKIEFYGSLPDFKIVMDELKKLDLLDEIGFNENTYENILMCICPNIIMTEEGLKVLPLGIFRLTLGNLDALDAYIIHELNHIYELELVSSDDKTTTYNCGWEEILQKKGEAEKVQSLDDDKTKRNYELLNEIINELISQDITKQMHEHGVYLFSHEDDARITGKTSYESIFFIVRDFYNIFYDDILASRRGNNIDKLISKVGEENFNALNDLFHIFYEHFSGTNYYKLRNELERNQDTEFTRIYHNIVSRKDKIIASMQKHAEEYMHQETSLT